jgi:PadR family transcriptional regulator PadR
MQLTGASQCRKRNRRFFEGTLDLMMLKTLDAMGPVHGYGVARCIEQVSQEALPGRKQLVAEADNWERVSGVIGRLLQLAPRK